MTKATTIALRGGTEMCERRVSAGGAKMAVLPLI